MLGMMYTINKDPKGVILVCDICSHTLRVNEFDGKLSCRRW